MQRHFEVLSMTQTTGRTATEERALKLLGSGLGPEIVASAVGVSVSRISQLLSDEEFSAAVSELRFNALQKHNETDDIYDEMEIELQQQFKSFVPLLTQPMQILKAMKEINSMKRRGQSAPESMTLNNQVVNLYMPTKIVQKFVTNINNQVVKAGEQELLTVQSSALPALAAASRRGAAQKGIGTENDETIIEANLGTSETISAGNFGTLTTETESTAN